MNDDRAKNIDRNDAEEQEDGLDKDLEGFVVNDNREEIGGDDQDMFKKFMDDANADDRLAIGQVYKSIILGQNRKRKRGDVDIDDFDDVAQRKLKRMEERANMLSDDSADEVMLEQQQRVLAEEEEMSDNEIVQQKELNDFYKFKRDMQKLGEDKLYCRYTNLRQKQQQEEDEIEMFVSSVSNSKQVKGYDSKVSKIKDDNKQLGSMLDRKKITAGMTFKTDQHKPSSSMLNLISGAS